MPKTNFSPIKHGFHFSNRFTNKIITSKFLNLETRGRCGGMAFASLDYYFSNTPIPKQKAEEFKHLVPDNGSSLGNYIYRRQIDSLLTLTSYKFVTWTLASDRSLLLHTKNREFRKLKRSIDRGKPVILGLISTKKIRELGKNHQVVAYGYDYNPAEDEFVIYIYDNNSPDQEITLTIDESSTHFIASNESIWRGFFVQHYKFKKPV